MRDILWLKMSQSQVTNLATGVTDSGATFVTEAGFAAV